MMATGWGFLLLSCTCVLLGQVDCATAASNASSVLDFSKYYAKSTTKTVTLARANQTTRILTSSDGSYAWQFFSHNKSQPEKRLLVVLSTLYNTTVVWIANRDSPVSGNASLQLRLPDGTLVLQDPSSSSSNSSGFVAWECPVSSIRSILMNETGNLVISHNSSGVAWQSFDYPADVVVPGQRLRTNRTAVSSRSWDDWSTGNFTLKADPGGAVLYATFDAQQTMVPYEFINYVATETSYNVSLHSACNHTDILYNYDASGVTLEQQDGFSSPECDAENGNLGVHGVTFATRIGGTGFRFLRVMPDGDIQSYFLDNSSSGLRLDNSLLKGFFSTFCKLPSYCGINSQCSEVQTCTCPDQFTFINPANSNGGCRLLTPLNCSVYMEHQFLTVPGTDYFANSYLDPRATVGSSEECQILCRANCSCTAAFFNNATGACHVYDQVQTMQYGSSPSVTALLRVAHLPATDTGGNGGVLSTKVIVGVTVGLAGVVVTVGLLLGWIAHKKLSKRDTDSDSEEEAFLESLPGLPPRFTYKELQDATQSFNKWLGKGASAAVYEGSLSLREGEPPVKVAIKELNISDRSTIAASSKRQFRAEVATLGSLNHVNLVQLKGFCAEGMHRLLIYEFMENSSLDRWIFPSKNTEGAQDQKPIQPILSWQVRYKIATDTARGLAFLHEESREKVVHLDVKPQNILLDGAFRAKLADFGLSKLMERGQSQTVTAMRGTPGYMAPEWFMDMAITPKSDVFSYGMVLLELVGGRKNLNLAVPSEEWYLAAWAVRQAEQGKLSNVVDKSLRQLKSVAKELEHQLPAEETDAATMMAHMKRLLNIAFWCIQEDANSRPSMTTVLLMLEEHLQVPDPPLHMAYVLRRQTRPASGFNSNAASSTATTTGFSTSSLTATTTADSTSELISELQPR